MATSKEQPTAIVTIGATFDQPDDEADINSLWKQALQDYEEKTGESTGRVSSLVAKDFKEVLNGTNNASTSFDARRHPNNKRTKARNALNSCLDWVVKGADLIKDHVTGDLAAPATVIAGAISLLVDAAHGVTDKLDLIAETFEDIKATMEDATNFTKAVPESKPFRNRLVRVFAALLGFCAYATGIFKDHGRVRLYFRTLAGLKNEVKEQSTIVKNAISRFKDAILSATYSVVDGTERKVTVIGKQVSGTEKQVTVIGTQVSGIEKQFRDMPDSIIDAFKAAKLDPSALQFTTTSKALDSIKKEFRLSQTAKAHLETQSELFEARFVKGTFEWYRTDTAYTVWESANRKPFLHVTGGPGTGKTFWTSFLLQNMRRSIKTRPRTSVACFLFQSGRQETQSLVNALHSIIVQVAEQDAKYRDLVSQTLEDLKKKATKIDTMDVKLLWSNFIESLFRRSTESPRTVYILLDGLEQMSPNEANELFLLFQPLDCEKHTIQIMFTGGDAELSKNIQTLKPAKIDLLQRTEDDIKRIIEHRLQHSVEMKRFSQAGQDDIRTFLGKKARGAFVQSVRSHESEVQMPSSSTASENLRTLGLFPLIDLALGRMEQIGIESQSLEEMRKLVDSPNFVQTSMSNLILGNRNFQTEKSVSALFKWTTLAKRGLSAFETRQFLTLEGIAADFDVIQEVEGPSNSMLQVVRRNEDDDYFFDDDPLKDQYRQYLPEEKTAYMKQQVELGRFDFVSFKQPTMKDYLQANANQLVQDAVQAKVSTFTTLCDVIADRTPLYEASRRALQQYAVSQFVDHLLEIDFEDVNETQTGEIVEGLSRIFTNENDCNLVFEAVTTQLNELTHPFDLYDLLDKRMMRGKTLRQVIERWARKVNYHGTENLTARAIDWLERLSTAPRELLAQLAAGHLRSWFSKVTVEDAIVPYKLAYRALIQTTYLTQTWTVENSELADTATVKHIFDIVRTYYYPMDRLEVDASARIAAALLLTTDNTYDTNNPLNTGSRRNIRLARKLYSENIAAGPPGVERFYSFVGLAELASPKQLESAIENASLAINERKAEKEALGTDINNDRAYKAYWIKGFSLQRIKNYEEALKTYDEGLDELDHKRRYLQFHYSIFQIFAQQGRHKEMMRKLENLSRDVRAGFLYFEPDNPPYEAESNFRTIRMAATAARRIDHLVRYYEDAIEYFSADTTSSTAMSLQVDLALIQRHDMRSTKLAKITLNEIRSTNLGGSRTGNVLRSVSGQLVDILYEEFSLATSESVRQEKVKDLKLLLDNLAGTGILDSMSQAEAFLALARMELATGDVTEAREQSDKAFRLCIEDLEDNVSWNDTAAFRMLTKLLMFANLTTDARIAGSLYFSEVDENNLAGSGTAAPMSTRSVVEDTDSQDQDADSDANSVRSLRHSDSEKYSLHTNRTKEQDRGRGNAPMKNGDLPIEMQEALKRVVELELSMKRRMDEMSLAVNATHQQKLHQAQEQPKTEGNFNKINGNGPADAQINGASLQQDLPIPEASDTVLKNRVNSGIQTELPEADIHGTTEADGSVRHPDSNDRAIETNTLKDETGATEPHCTEETINPPSPAALTGEHIGPEASTSASRPISPTTTHPASDVAPGMIKRRSRTEDLVSDSDPDFGLFCDGRCPRQLFQSWASPSPNLPRYRCLDCPMTDFCAECFEVQDAYNKGEGDGLWTRVCWGEHQYLLLPIEGWEGVLNGSIRRGGKSKKFKSWLGDVKGRWRRALAELGKNEGMKTQNRALRGQMSLEVMSVSTGQSRV